MTQAEVDALSDEDIAVLERATQKLANEVQRQGAAYQRQADRLRKAIKRRKDREQVPSHVLLLRQAAEAQRAAVGPDSKLAAEIDALLAGEERAA